MSTIKEDALEIRQRTAVIQSLCQELASLNDLPTIKTIADKAEALQVWAARARQGRELWLQAGEIRVRAARRGGLILASMDRGYKGKGKSSKYNEACDEAGVAQWQARLWQRVADIPEPQFEKHLEEDRKERKPTSIRQLVRGRIDNPKDGCAIFFRLNAKETRALDKIRNGTPRDEFVKAALLSVL